MRNVGAELNPLLLWITRGRIGATPTLRTISAAAAARSSPGHAVGLRNCSLTFPRCQASKCLATYLRSVVHVAHAPMRQWCAMSDRAIRPPWRKRYGWYRLYYGFWRHPKWKVAARLAGGIHVTAAICVVGTLLECANKSKPRGCVEDYSFDEAAASLDLETQDVERVYGALEGMGWVDRAFLVTWDERQPDNEDPTAAERMARMRMRKRQNPALGKSEQNQRESLRVTLRPDSVSKKERGGEITPLAPGATVTWKQAQEAGYVPAKQRSLPLPPVPLNQRGNR
jgi:hypothetical protein